MSIRMSSLCRNHERNHQRCLDEEPNPPFVLVRRHNHGGIDPARRCARYPRDPVFAVHVQDLLGRNNLLGLRTAVRLRTAGHVGRWARAGELPQGQHPLLRQRQPVDDDTEFGVSGAAVVVRHGLPLGGPDDAGQRDMDIACRRDAVSGPLFLGDCNQRRQGLPVGTTYWIRIKSNSVDFSANHYEVATSTTVGTTLKSSDGSSWSAASVGLYFRMVGSDTRQKWHLFEYGGALFGATQPYSGAAGQLFINGDNGAADSNSGDKTLLNDATKSWTTNEWANAVALIVAGPGKGEFRKISSNTATALTVSPAWDTTHTTASDYVIIGSSKWTERATTGLTGPVTDVAVAQGVMYLAQGNAINIRRHREYNSSGTWTISDYADDGTNKADFLETFYDPVAGPVMWTASNSDGSGNVSIARANAQTWGTSLTLGTAIQIGTRDSKITGLAIYNDMLWVGKEESLWYVQNDVPNRLDLGLQAIRSPDNCKAIGAQNLFLYFNWAHSLERLYGGTTDDIGPWRDAGLPSSRQGVISALLPAIAWLFVGIDAGDTGRSSVLVYSGGWHEIFRAWETARRIDNLYWQSVLGTVNRMWVSVGGDLVWLPFPRVSLNPLRDGDMTFQHEGHIVSPWMDMGFPELDGFAKSEGVRADNLSIAERLTVQTC